MINEFWPLTFEKILRLRVQIDFFTMKPFLKNQELAKGFTLIELLVVIVIIGILATVSTATYKGTIEKAEEAKMISELGQAINRSKARRAEYEGGLISESDLLSGEFGELEIIDATINLA